MDDLISRKALLEFAHNHIGGRIDCNDIARFPAVEAEHVRCGNSLGKPENCEYYTTSCFWGGGGCLGTREIDPCEGKDCKKYKPKMDGGAEG